MPMRFFPPGVLPICSTNNRAVRCRATGLPETCDHSVKIIIVQAVLVLRRIDNSGSGRDAEAFEIANIRRDNALKSGLNEQKFHLEN